MTTSGTGVRGLSTPGGGLSPPSGLGEGSKPPELSWLSDLHPGVQRFSTGETTPSGSVFGNLREYKFYCCVHQSGSNQEGKHTAMGTGKVECQEEVPSVEQSEGCVLGGQVDVQVDHDQPNIAASLSLWIPSDFLPH